MSAQMHLPTFYVLQKFSMTANRYSIQAADQAGSPVGSWRWRSRSGWRSRSR